MTLSMIVGLPKGGKTTYAKKLKAENPDAVMVSFDDIKATIDPSVEDVDSDAMRIVCEQITVALKSGRDVIYDNSNVTRASRKIALDIATEFSATKNVIIAWAPYDYCVDRGADSDPEVAEEVILEAIKTWQSPYYDEGIDKIKVVIATDYPVSDHCILKNAEYMQYIIRPDSTISILEHCMGASRVADELGKPLDIIDAAAWHDVGKAFVREVIGNCEEFVETLHDNVGGYLIFGAFPVNKMRLAIAPSWIICHHMDARDNTEYYQSLPRELQQKLEDIHEVTTIETDRELEYEKKISNGGSTMLDESGESMIQFIDTDKE